MINHSKNQKKIKIANFNKLKSLADGTSHADLHESVPFIGNSSMKLHSNISNFGHDLVSHLLIIDFMFYLILTEIQTDNHFF